MVRIATTARLAQTLQECRVFLMVGYPGSGKSTLARKMALAWSAHYLSSDELRAQLFNSTRYDRVGDAVIAKQREQLYPLLAATILDRLQQFQQVILDATNLETSKRELITQILSARLLPTQLCFVCVKTPYREIRARLQLLEQTQQSELLDDWERVYRIFQAKKRQGLISWPQAATVPNPVVSAQRMYAFLQR